MNTKTQYSGLDVKEVWNWECCVSRDSGNDESRNSSIEIVLIICPVCDHNVCRLCVKSPVLVGKSLYRLKKDFSENMAP